MTPAPSSVYETVAAAPDAAFELEGVAVQPPDADGLDTLLVALDALDSGAMGPLAAAGATAATVTVPPVAVELDVAPAALELEGTVVKPPDAAGFDALLVTVDGLDAVEGVDGGVLDPLAGAVTVAATGAVLPVAVVLDAAPAVLALEGAAVKPPEADGFDTLVVAVDGLDGGASAPLAVAGTGAATVTMPPVAVEYVDAPPANAAAIDIDELEGDVPLVVGPAPELLG